MIRRAAEAARLMLFGKTEYRYRAQPVNIL